MVSIDELTIDQVHAAFKSGAHNSWQLVDAYIRQIELLDRAGPKLNAITVVSHFALEEADALDAHYATHGLFVGPLHGIPVIVKDQCDTKGVETAYGNICCKHIPTKDSTLVEKLRAAGAIILAKSTMPGLFNISQSCDYADLFYRLRGIIQFYVLSEWRDFESLRNYQRDRRF